MLNGFTYVTGTRYIVNPNEKLVTLIKKECGLSDDEKILMIIDDSLFKTKTKYVVFTNMQKEKCGAIYVKKN